MRQVSSSMARLGVTLLQTRLIVPHGFMARQKYDDAIEATEVVLDEFTSTYGSDHPLVAKIWIELAEMNRLAGNSEESVRCLQEASAIVNEISQKKQTRKA